MILERIYDPDLAQVAWLVGCQATREALIIDPERDIDRYIEVADKHRLRIIGVAETHIHADFLSGTKELAIATGATAYLSSHGGEDWSYSWPTSSDVAVQFVSDKDIISIGNLKVTVIHTPGHTPEHICFLVNDVKTKEPIGCITGDFVFVGDLGRPDLLETAAGIEGAMQASAEELHESCERFMELEDYVQVWPGHGAGSACGKALGAVPQSTVGYEKRTSPPLQFVGEETRFIEYMLADQPEPPLYFARMKQMNRDGVPILGKMPTPRKVTDASELVVLSSTKTVIDTRPWNEVREGHLPNSIWSQANGDFHRFAGSFVSEEEELVFIVSEENLNRALRNAIRIGLDRITAWAEPSLLIDVQGLVSMSEISAKEFESVENATVLDVRRMPEFADGSIGDSINIAHTQLFGRLDELDASVDWVVHCLGGSRSAATCMAMQRSGFNVTNLAGGYNGWREYQQSCTVSQ